jgi:DUF4097 and DUF4098 domain-containing protein YvlB
MEPITFDTPGRVELDVRIASGEVEVALTDTDVTVVDVGGRGTDDVRVERMDLADGGHLVGVELRGLGKWGRHPSLRVRIATRAGVALRCETGSADLSVRGALGALEARSASGDVTFGDVEGDAAVKLASGDVRGGRVGGSATIETASGDVRLDGVGADLVAHLASGDLRADSVAGSVKASTASGDLSIGAVERGAVVLSSMSGDISVGVRAGTRVWLDLSSVSGSATSELAPSGASAEGETLELRASSVSGDVRVSRAGPGS